jgi:hypothetical protein
MVPGNVASTGTITMECFDDVIVYYLYAMRMSIVRTGPTGGNNYTYVCTPTSVAVFPTRTLSITIVRNQQVFGYVGCVVHKLTLAIQNTLLQMDVDVMFQNEAAQALPTPTWNTSTPYGPGLWNIGIPTGTQVFDMDTFSFSIDEAGANQYRLKNTGPNAGRGAQYISLGERTVAMTATRDFFDRTDYNAYQAGAAQSMTIQAQKSAVNFVQFQMNSTFKSAMQTVLAAQGDIIRSSLTYDSTVDTSGNAAVITVGTQELIV